jgi:hypothetical protein
LGILTKRHRRTSLVAFDSSPLRYILGVVLDRSIGNLKNNSNRTTGPTERIASPGQSPTATAAIVTTHVGRLSMRLVPRRNDPDEGLHALLKEELAAPLPALVAARERIPEVQRERGRVVGRAS